MYQSARLPSAEKEHYIQKALIPKKVTAYKKENLKYRFCCLFIYFYFLKQAF